MWHWTIVRERAADLAAADDLSDPQIAERCGVKRDSIARWRRVPAFQARVAEIVAKQAAAIQAAGIADKRNRVNAQNDRWRRMQALMAARAQMYGDVPGGETGLVVLQQKALGSGSLMEVIDEYVLDAALLRELRAHEEQAAKELGQWTEKLEHSGSVLIREYGGFDPDSV